MTSDVQSKQKSELHMHNNTALNKLLPLRVNVPALVQHEEINVYPERF